MQEPRGKKVKKNVMYDPLKLSNNENTPYVLCFNVVINISVPALFTMPSSFPPLQYSLLTLYVWREDKQNLDALMMAFSHFPVDLCRYPPNVYREVFSPLFPSRSFR